jgi:hypothetical protein
LCLEATAAQALRPRGADPVRPARGCRRALVRDLSATPTPEEQEREMARFVADLNVVAAGLVDGTARRSRSG